MVFDGQGLVLHDEIPIEKFLIDHHWTSSLLDDL